MSSVSVEQSDVFVKVTANVCGSNIRFLVDSGASHNFISAQVLQQLGIQPHRREKVKVRMADQSMVVTDQYIHVLVVFGKGVSALLRFTVLPVDCPSILGMPFLRQLNPHIDWKSKSVIFAGRSDVTTTTSNMF